jgi:hypothetical protein
MRFVNRSARANRARTVLEIGNVINPNTETRNAVDASMQWGASVPHITIDRTILATRTARIGEQRGEYPAIGATTQRSLAPGGFPPKAMYNRSRRLFLFPSMVGIPPRSAVMPRQLIQLDSHFGVDRGEYKGEARATGFRRNVLTRLLRACMGGGNDAVQLGSCTSKLSCQLDQLTLCAVHVGQRERFLRLDAPLQPSDLSACEEG